jgi:hypothetical protein
LIGGNGGGGVNGATGGAGTSASLNNGISGSTTGALSLTQSATGGNGGSATGSINAAGGAGASANSQLYASTTSPTTLSMTVNATGGNGGSGAGSGAGGIGGNAVAYANGSFTASTATTVAATATGGTGAGSTLSGTALATAVASGNSGNATATANADGIGLVTLVSGQATSALVGMSGPAGTAESETMIGQSPSSLSLGSSLQASTIGIGSPLASEVNAAWNGNTNVPTAFGTPANVQGLAVMTEANANFGVTSTYGYVSEASFTLNGSMLNSESLVVGLFSPTVTGVGLHASDSLTFEIDRQGVPVVEKIFTSNAAMQAYFSDNVLNLGAENAGLNGSNLNLEFKFDFSSSASGAGFSENIVFGDAILVPEPSSSALLALGVFGLLSRATFLRLRRRSRG